jgi:predicted AlkP superfamily pyrophosphatase or phosphodiesterase
MRAEVSNARWWGGEPFWVTAEKQGVMAAPFFWPGSEAPIGGIRPSYWKAFDGSITEERRVEQVLQWLDLPVERRPGIVTLYFDRLDNAGHQYGPDYAAVDTAVRIIDGAIGILVKGLKKRNLFENAAIIILSDHGMAPVEKERTIYLDDYLPAADSVRIVDWGIVVSLWPRPGSEERTYRSLRGAHPHMRVFAKDSIPARWHYRKHRRVAPIVIVAEEGWMITNRGNRSLWARSVKGGNHGYDNEAPSMRGIFIAHGPGFKAGRVVEPFENVQIYNLLCSLLQITPAANDGDMKVAKSLIMTE